VLLLLLLFVLVTVHVRFSIPQPAPVHLQQADEDADCMNFAAVFTQTPSALPAAAAAVVAYVCYCS
jgi:hypothetical protein